MSRLEDLTAQPHPVLVESDIFYAE